MEYSIRIQLSVRGRKLLLWLHTYRNDARGPRVVGWAAQQRRGEIAPVARAHFTPGDYEDRQKVCIAALLVA